MDFQDFVERMASLTCVVSVEKLEDGKYGKVRIVTGNKAYIDSIEHPMENMRMLTDKFTPNSEYTNYFTRDLNFEDACYRAAVLKKCVHAYAHPDRYDIWFNMTFMPLCPDDGNICYCTYTMEVDFEPNAERLSNVDSSVASSVLDTCIKLRGATDFVATMRDVIVDIRKLCKAESCYILLVDKVMQTCSVLCEDNEADDTRKSMKDVVDNGFYDVVSTWEDTISGSNCLVVKNESGMEVIRERNPVWYESLVASNVNTMILFPLKSGTRLLGYIHVIGFDAEDAGRIKETLEVTTFILGSEIANHLLVDQLKILSSRDILTGVLNRNEMNNYVERLSRERELGGNSTGVVFADLNGLKNVNDNEGHVAGDRLLKDAADSLREVFSDAYIFRAGGDEFTVIVNNVNEEELGLMVQKLRKVSKNYDKVSFAVGFCCVDKTTDIRMALRLADERMYEDKRIYYENHPEKRRSAYRDDYHYDCNSSGKKRDHK